MTELRDVNIQKDMLRFRRNLERIGEIMAYEISKTLDYDTVDTLTPLAMAKSEVIATQVVLATIFRAGVPFHQGFLNYLDHAENAFVSAYRKYKEKENFDVCIEYLASFPANRRQNPYPRRPDAGNGSFNGIKLPGTAHQRHPCPNPCSLSHSLATGR